MSEKIYLYPVWIRIWHWINALLFLLLIVTGLSMQYSSPNYTMIRFDIAVSFHNVTGFILIFNYIFFIIANWKSRNFRYYKCHVLGCSTRLQKQFRYYLYGIFKNEKAPFPISEDRKFNPLQKLSYLIAMYLLMPVMIITGLALIVPEVNIHNVFGISGIHLTDLLHITSGFVLSVFMIVHIYFCTIGKTATSNFKSMIDGWH
ncbi:MAG: cytochrome b/b6 domain-containing protein [Bacteroidales bacterium]|nr:cytochrome b/b6 domain-containing protein [Bacteroidales bacterium]MCF8404731.1 cytochrome b/b6 domain-containing protein [Bacteroidales bacterium]